jgi:hypothetical protein
MYEIFVFMCLRNELFRPPGRYEFVFLIISNGKFAVYWRDGLDSDIGR